jgi:hypothetical protein
MPDEKCETCRYFDPVPDDIAQEWAQFDGLCRRYPPPDHMVPGTVNTSFPLVRFVDWCGEYKSAGSGMPPAPPT